MNRGDRLSQEQRETVVDIANRMMAEGKKRNEILDALIDRFDFASRQTASRSVALAGGDLPPPQRKPNHGRPDARLAKRYKPVQVAIQQDKPNLFEEAAEKVAGAFYDGCTGMCFIGRTPITGIELMRRAGMELPQ
ncbi:MAG: hypothetical protein ACMZ66_05475 [Thalassospira sp.]|uniref:hypothetical protein n=1 Tax=Thalassospira sp. TaxID=1912094 RepID=UPI003A88014F